MKKIILLGLACSLLFSCSKGLDLELQNFIYEKNKECESYTEEISENYLKGEFTYSIFYSPKLNSCVYRTASLNSKNHYLINYFTKEEITWKSDFCDGFDDICLRQQKKFNSILEDLRK